MGAPPTHHRTLAEASSTPWPGPGRAECFQILPYMPLESETALAENHCCGPRTIPMAVTDSLESWSGPRGRKGEGPRGVPMCVFRRPAGPGLSRNHRSLSQHRVTVALWVGQGSSCQGSRISTPGWEDQPEVSTSVPLSGRAPPEASSLIAWTAGHAGPCSHPGPRQLLLRWGDRGRLSSS